MRLHYNEHQKQWQRGWAKWLQNNHTISCLEMLMKDTQIRIMTYICKAQLIDITINCMPFEEANSSGALWFHLY